MNTNDYAARRALIIAEMASQLRQASAKALEAAVAAERGVDLEAVMPLAAEAFLTIDRVGRAMGLLVQTDEVQGFTPEEISDAEIAAAAEQIDAEWEAFELGRE